MFANILFFLSSSADSFWKPNVPSSFPECFTALPSHRWPPKNWLWVTVTSPLSSFAAWMQIFASCGLLATITDFTVCAVDTPKEPSASILLHARHRHLPPARAAAWRSDRLAASETRTRSLIRRGDITAIQPRLRGTNLLFAPALH